MNTAAPLPVPDGAPEPHPSRGAAPNEGSNAFANILAALAAQEPPPTDSAEAEARTADAEGTEAGSDSPGPTQTPPTQTPPTQTPGAVAAPLEGTPIGADLVAAPPVVEPSTTPAPAAVAPSPAPGASVPPPAAADPAPVVPTQPAAAGAPGATGVEVETHPTAPAQSPVPSAAVPQSTVPEAVVPQTPAPETPVPPSAPQPQDANTAVDPSPPSLAAADPGNLADVTPVEQYGDIVVELGPRSSGHAGDDRAAVSRELADALDRAPGGRDEGGVYDSRGGQSQLRDDAHAGARTRGTGPVGAPIGIDLSGQHFEVASAAASEAPPASARLNELAEKTRATIRFAVRHGHTDARITLRPAELGEVRIALRYENGGVSATLTADSSKSFEALAQAASDLRRSLEQQGLTVQSLEVRLGGEGARRDPSGWEGGMPLAANPFDNQLGEDEPEDEAGEQTQPGASSGGVDVLA